MILNLTTYDALLLETAIRAATGPKRGRHVYVMEAVSDADHVRLEQIAEQIARDCAGEPPRMDHP